MKISFSNLISPLSVEDFFQTYWEKKLLHLKQNRAELFSKILSVSDLDDYLRRQDLSPLGFRLAVSGDEIDQREWTKQERLLHGTTKTIVNPEKVFDLFSKGATIIINSAQTGMPVLAEACRALEQEFKFSLQTNIYITPPNSQGFAMHYDPHDIISLQIRGRKFWRILDSGEELPTRLGKFGKEPELVEEFYLEEGDLLYIPRGTVHEAFASEEATIHVNFSFKPRYGFQLLEELAALAEAEESFFRKTIPNGFATEAERRKYAEEFSEKMSALLEKYRPEKLLEKQSERFVERQCVDFSRRFSDLLEIGGINSKTIVARRAGLSISVKNKANGISINFGKNEIAIPKFIKPDIFFRDEPFTAEQIEGLISEKGKIEIIRELVKKGFLRIEKI